MKALYLGDLDGTSRHRSEALKRLGWELDIIDPRACFGNSRFAEMWIWHAGSVGMESLVRRYVLDRMKHDRYDVCVVSHGELVGPSLLRALRPRVGALINYNGDNPFVARDHNRWRLFRKAMHLYDLHGTPRVSTAEEGERLGLNMLRFVHCADEVVHKPRPFSPEDQGRYGSDVSFIGTWMPERGPFVCGLLDAGVAIRIFGGNWHKAPEYERLKHAIVIPHLLGDEDYVRAIQYAKIALGFVSIANKDFHTGRSTEVPSIGTLLCAMRTDQHMELYREDQEAVFWDDMDDCAAKCRQLIANPDRIATIAAAGAARQAASPHWNEIVMTRLIDEALAIAGRRSPMALSA